MSKPDTSRHGPVVNQERPFAVEELFFSTTDVKGFIQSSNEVFVRISGYEHHELIGRPHNIIRHPDMPRVVFRLLWQQLEAGEPIAAYVKNRAKDGTYYWVLAAARPIEGGYLSVRLKPTSPWFDAVRSIYTELLTAEQAIEQSDGSRREAMDASAAILDRRLAAAGFADYSDFMRTVVATEVKSRRDLVEQHRYGTRPADAPRSLTEHLAAELDAIERYMGMNQQLAERSTALAGLAEEGQILAINAVLASRRLGADGAALAAVAQALQHTFPRVVERSRSVVEQITDTRAALQRIGLAVGLAVLQDEMVSTFTGELDGVDVDDAAAAEASRNLVVLRGCLRDDLTAVMETLRAISTGVAQIASSARELDRDLGQLAAIEVQGRIEAARTGRAEGFGAMLEHTRDRVSAAREQLAEIVTLIDRLATSNNPELRRALAADLAELNSSYELAAVAA